MSEVNQSKEEQQELLDITWIVDQFFYAFKRLWWLVLILILAFVGLSYYRTINNYVPTYRAEATLTISAAGEEMTAGSDNYNNVVTAQQLGKIFPYILTSGVLSDAVAEDMGEEKVPGTISVTAVSGTNLITINTVSQDAEKAYQILQSVIRVYPSVAQFVVGQTKVNILDDSGIPENSSKLTVTRRSLAKGAVLGAIAGMAVLSFYVLMRRTVRTSRQLKNLIKFPTLGSLPLYKNKKYRKANGRKMNLLSERVPHDYLESIRSLRTRVGHQMKKRGSKTLLVTSSVPSEGKSTVATNLAISFAQKGDRVILVDCDLKHPSIQNCLNVSGSYRGVSSVLRKEVPLKEALYQMPGEGINLKVLFGSVEDVNSSDIFSTERIKSLIQEMEKLADIVIVDACPAALFSEAIMWSQSVGQTLYVVKYDSTKVHSILDGVQELSATGTEIIGCVLNACKFTDSVSGNGNGTYGKYGKYGRYGKYYKSGYYGHYGKNE